VAINDSARIAGSSTIPTRQAMLPMASPTKMVEQDHGDAVVEQQFTIGHHFQVLRQPDLDRIAMAAIGSVDRTGGTKIRHR
jgi:hypothetical protein